MTRRLGIPLGECRPVAVLAVEDLPSSKAKAQAVTGDVSLVILQAQEPDLLWHL